MKKTSITIIAVICLIALIVGVFAACKKKSNGEIDVSVATDENGSLYYTDPTQEIDGITYGGETHFVKPEETNKNGEYRIHPDNTSTPYTTDSEGNVAPVTKETPTTAPDNSSGGTTGNNDQTQTKPTDNTNPSGSSNESTSESTTEELHGLSGADDGNNLSDDGVINAW